MRFKSGTFISQAVLKWMLPASLIVVLIAPVKAQNVLSGKVVNKENQGLELIPVMILHCQDSTVIKGALTDSNGHFSLKDLGPDSCFLSVSNMGYRSFLIKIRVKADTFITIPLDPAANSLKGVTIVSKTGLIERKVDRLIFHADKTLFSVGNSAWDLLKKAPGILADESGQLSIRSIPGAVVYLNDRRVYLSGEELMNMLKGLSADEVSKIEIIPNPPARYDAEGSGGVINIILKKNLHSGFSGNVFGGYEQTFYPKGNAGVNLNFRNKKWYVYGSLNYRSGFYLKQENRNELFTLSGHSTQYTENIRSKTIKNDQAFVLGTVYDIAKSHSIAFTSDGNLSKRHSMDQNNGLYSQSDIKDSSINTSVDTRNRQQYLTANFNYKWEIDTSGKTLGADAGYMFYSVPEFSSVNNSNIYDTDSNLFLHYIDFKSSTNQRINLYFAKADYTHPLSSDSKLDMGIKYTNTVTQNEVIFQNESGGNIFISDTARSNTFRYTENTQAAYINYNSSFKKTDLEIGLRAEDTHALGTDKTNNKVLQKDYLKLFPSLFLQYKLNDKTEAGLTYNRRIARPPFAALNPFRYYSSPYSYSLGNTFLQPSFTDAFEFNISLHQTWFLAAFCNFISGQFSQVIEQNPLSNTNRYVWVNIDHSYDYGISASTSFTPYKWWSVNGTLIFKINGSRSNLTDSYYQNESGVFYVITNQSFRISPKYQIQAEINENYASPGTVQGLFRLGGMLDVSAGIKKTFANKKASVVLSFSDIFRGTYITASTSYKGQTSFINGNYDQQGIRITFSYKFGNTGIEKDRKPIPVNSDDKERVK